MGRPGARTTATTETTTRYPASSRSTGRSAEARSDATAPARRYRYSHPALRYQPTGVSHARGQIVRGAPARVPGERLRVPGPGRLKKLVGLVPGEDRPLPHDSRRGLGESQQRPAQCMRNGHDADPAPHRAPHHADEHRAGHDLRMAGVVHLAGSPRCGPRGDQRAREIGAVHRRKLLAAIPKDRGDAPSGHPEHLEHLSIAGAVDHRWSHDHQGSAPSFTAVSPASLLRPYAVTGRGGPVPVSGRPLPAGPAAAIEET